MVYIFLEGHFPLFLCIIHTHTHVKSVPPSAASLARQLARMLSRGPVFPVITHYIPRSLSRCTLYIHTRWLLVFFVQCRVAGVVATRVVGLECVVVGYIRSVSALLIGTELTRFWTDQATLLTCRRAAGPPPPPPPPPTLYVSVCIH